MQGAATLQLFYFTEEFGGVGFTVPTANLITKFQDLLEETDKIQIRKKNPELQKVQMALVRIRLLQEIIRRLYLIFFLNNLAFSRFESISSTS